MLTIVCIAATLSASGNQTPRDTATPTDTATIERAAAAYAADHLLRTIAAGPRAFDPQSSDGHRRSPEQVAALARLLNAETIPRTAVVTCKHGLESCEMGRYAGIVTLGVLSTTDSTAEVTVRIEWPVRSVRQPVALFEPTLLFVRSNGAWHFARIVEVRST